MNADEDLLTTARSCCTERQAYAYELAGKGLSQRAIAYALGVSRSAVRDLLAEANRKVALRRESTT